MSRFIDADKLIRHLEDEIEECKPPFEDFEVCDRSSAYGTILGLRMAIAFANTLPAVDVGKIFEEMRAIFGWLEEHFVNLNFVSGNVELNFGDYLAFKESIEKKYTEGEG